MCRRWFAGRAVCCVLLAALGTSSAQTPSRATSRRVPQGIQKIQHIIYIVKENRSFDNYFGRFPNALGATIGINSLGQAIPLGRTPDETPVDLDHSWQGAVTGINGGKMDRWDLINWANIDGQYMAFTTLTQEDIPNYWAYAQNFVLADQMFSSMTGPSFPEHLYTVAAQGGGALNIPTGYEHDGPANWGCDSDPGSFVQVMDPVGNVSTPFPCFDFNTLVDELEAAGISWKYYAPGQGSSGYIFSALDAINHIRNSPLWTQHVVSPDQFIVDLQNGQLPAVSWIVQGFEDSEHPPHSTCRGENYTVEQINALMQSPYWNSSAIFLTWDDWGGFYDHYPPPLPPPDIYGYGPRVPLMIISPYSKSGYISHTVYEFSSVLKFIEEDFGLAPITERDANANDTSDSFDFDQSPNPPLVLSERNCPLLCASTAYFGTTVVGGSTDYVVVLYNQRDVPLNISNISVSGDYSETSGCPAQVSAHASCKIKVTFKPTQTGNRTGTLTVTDSDPSSPQTTNLQGTGTYAELLPRFPGFSFPTQPVGSKGQAKNATLTNRGPVPLTISKITTVGNYTEADNCPQSLDPGDDCDIAVTFTPADSTLQLGQVAVFANDPGSPVSVRLRGYGLVANVSPKTLKFPPRLVGTTSPAKQVTLTNLGSTVLNISSITASGDFEQENDCGSSLPSQSSCTISVSFKPTRSGTRTGTVQLVDSDFGSPQTVNLSGVGVGVTAK